MDLFYFNKMKQYFVLKFFGETESTVLIDARVAFMLLVKRIRSYFFL